jgi:hypothetical protein
LNAPLVIDDAGLEICGRFGFLHSRLRKQVDGDDRGSGSGNSDRQNAPHSRRIFIKQQLKALLGDTLSEYGLYAPLYESYQQPLRVEVDLKVV